ncbi:MAG: DUF1476 domain-containing protein [Rhodobacteraceae bacterium]|nr:DUF1476 domain-containing protein [Paracoccaceae bacterium]
MSTFEERQSAFEAKFAHDEEMLFRARARRNKLLGLWVAELMGKTGEDAQVYAMEVVKVDFQEQGDANIVRKVVADLEGRVAPEEITARLPALMAEAKAQIAAEN